jgi:hypothetical protein
MSNNDTNKSDSIKRKCLVVTSNPFFIIGLLFLFLVEVRLIYKLWIRPQYSVDLLSALVLQFAYLLPFLVISIIWYTIDKHLNKEEISPSFAEALNNRLFGLVIVVYIAFSFFLNYVGR